MEIRLARSASVKCIGVVLRATSHALIMLRLERFVVVVVCVSGATNSLELASVQRTGTVSIAPTTVTLSCAR